MVDLSFYTSSTGIFILVGLLGSAAILTLLMFVVGKALKGKLPIDKVPIIRLRPDNEGHQEKALVSSGLAILEDAAPAKQELAYFIEPDNQFEIVDRKGKLLRAKVIVAFWNNPFPLFRGHRRVTNEELVYRALMVFNASSAEAIVGGETHADENKIAFWHWAVLAVGLVWALTMAIAVWKAKGGV